MATLLHVHELGWRAEAALQRTGGRARGLAALSESRYLMAEDELLWLGPSGTARHGRALAAADPLPDLPPGQEVELDLRGARVWRPFPVSPTTLAALRGRAGELVAALPSAKTPPGFGALLVGGPLTFPLERAAAPARALLAASLAEDADAAVAAAAELIGLGPGLTPAGDDFVGGVFFARAQLSPESRTNAAGWQQAAAAVLDVARERTHPISRVLLADLVSGHGHACLHELAQALASGAPLGVGLDAARRITRIGHSSGWDMLAGFVLAIGGP